MNSSMNMTKDTQTLSASTIMGTKVVNGQNENIGTIQDLMLDLDKGCTRYAVLDFGGVLGVGNKLFAVPFDAFTVDTDKERFVLGVDKEVLKNAEGFDKNNWPNFADRQFEERLHSYYGVKPYWR